MSRLADALGAKFLYYLGEFATFVRYVPLILSLIVVEGLMLRQLGEYFGVHNLVDYDKWSLQIGSGSGFGLMLVYLHCLYIGFLLVRAYRQNDPPKFRSFLTIVPLFSLVFVFLGYGFLSSLEGFRELLTHLWFCTGMAIALVLLTACHQLGETAAGWVLNRSEATIVDKCEQWRQQKENRLDFYCGTAIFLSYFVAMILLVTWVGAQRPTWVMYVFAAPFGVIFFAAAFRCRFSLPLFAAAFRGPDWFRERVIRAIGAEQLLNRPEGVHLVLGWLFFLIAGETIVCFMSLSRLGGSPITTICAMWVGVLACYLLFRNVTIRAPFAVITVVGLLVMLGGINSYKYRFAGDLSYQKDAIIQLIAEAERDHERQKWLDDQKAQLLKTNKGLSLDANKLNQLLGPLRTQLLNQNRVVAPRANWLEGEISRPVSHGLLDIRDLKFRRYDASPRRPVERPLVLVAVSGGGLRSAAWTYCVLKMLEDELAREGIDFASHVRRVWWHGGCKLLRRQPRRDGNSHRANAVQEGT